MALGWAIWAAPRWLIPVIAARSPRCVFEIATEHRAVALTLDDGPDGEHTPEILRVLREDGAHATFFMISEHVAGCEEIVSSVVAAGHEIGNHLTRDESSIRLAPAAFAAALREAGRVLERFGPVRWLRPGSARYSASMLATIEQAGYRCALGSIYPYDVYVPLVRFASAYILAAVRPGAVIVLHERGSRGLRSVATLRRVLPALRQRGYRVLSLSELDRLRLTPPQA